MVSFGISIPLLLVGAVIWVVIAALRRHTAGPFTLATAVSIYARFATLVTSVLAVAGASIVAKILISLIQLDYSYYVYSCQPAGNGQENCGMSVSAATYQRSQELILAIVLIVAGVALAALHTVVARVAQTREGGHPSWIDGAWLVSFTVISGVLGVGGLVVGLYQLLTQALLGSAPGNAGPNVFGDALGLAVAFLPAWIVFLRLLTRRVAATPSKPPAQLIDTAAGI